MMEYLLRNSAPEWAMLGIAVLVVLALVVESIRE